MMLQSQADYYGVSRGVADHGVPIPQGTQPKSQLVVFNSNDRENPTQSQNGRYYIDCPWKGDNVFAVQLKSFSGSIAPYNVSTVADYRIVITIPGGITFTTTIDFVFNPGDWTLQAILDTLNDQPYLRFSFNETTNKVIVERLTGWIGSATGNDFPTTSGNTIGALIGFPQGFTLASTDNAIQTVYAVSTHTVTGSVLIAFDVFPTTLQTTGNIGAGFQIPLNTGTFNANDRKLYFTEQQGYFQTIRVNNIKLDKIGVRILDAKTGSPFVFVGPHVMALNFLYFGASPQR